MARSAVRPRARGRIEDHHAEWLSLVETSGPFLTVPALKRALPDGLEATTIMPDLRVAYAEWQSDPGLQRRWVRWVLDELLGLRDAVAEATDADPSHRVAEQAVTLGPSYVVRDRGQDGDPVVLLVHRYEQGTALSRPLPGETWAATPLDRAAELARAAGVPLALVTDGARWTLVWAREGESTGMCTWRSELWLEEPITLRAFVTLLGARRFFALPVEEGLAALLAESAGKQQEVADQLGAQVRRAVELLITTLDYEDRERHGELLAGLEQAEVYRGAVTVMMRLVFLFVAEERRLLADRRPPLCRDPGRQHAARPAPGARRPRGRGPARALDRRLAPDPGAVPRRARRDRARRAATPRLRRRAVRPRPLPVPRGPPARQPVARAGGPPAAGRRPHDAPPARRAADARTGRRARAALLPSARRRADRPRLRGPARPHRRADHRRLARARRQARARARPRRARTMGGDRQRHARSSASRRRPAARRARSARRSPASCPTSNAPDYAPRAATTTRCSIASLRTTRCCARTCAATRS